MKTTLILLFITISSFSYFIKSNNVNKNSILSKNLFYYFDSLKSETKNNSTIFFIENKDIFSKYSIFKINSMESLIPRFFVRNNFNFFFQPIKDKNFNPYSNDNNLKIYPGDGKALEPIAKKILSDPNFIVLYLDTPSNMTKFREVINYYLFHNQCIVVINPIGKINKKFCNNNS